jgi:hypothetical protein
VDHNYKTLLKNEVFIYEIHYCKMKKDLNEQISRIKNMMGRITNESFDDMSYKVDSRSKTKSPEQLIKSMTDRLMTAVQMQEWSLVEEVAMDALNYVNNVLSKDNEAPVNHVDDFDTQVQPEEMPDYDYQQRQAEYMNGEYPDDED